LRMERPRRTGRSSASRLARALALLVMAAFVAASLAGTAAFARVSALTPATTSCGGVLLSTALISAATALVCRSTGSLFNAFGAGALKALNALVSGAPFLIRSRASEMTASSRAASVSARASRRLG